MLTVRNLEDETRYAVVKDSDPLLQTISLPVTEFNADLKHLCVRMLKTVEYHQARGISAIQLGIAQRVILAVADGKTLLMVNPVVVRTLNRFTTEREGCLSIHPAKWRDVSRPAKCELTWQDWDGQDHSGNFAGDMARVLQHELDHLDGILITDKAPLSIR
jgi:peptide deformylase